VEEKRKEIHRRNERTASEGEGRKGKKIRFSTKEEKKGKKRSA